MNQFVSEPGLLMPTGEGTRRSKVETRKGVKNDGCCSREKLIDGLVAVPDLEPLVNSEDTRLQRIGKALQIITAYSCLAFDGNNKLNFSSSFPEDKNSVFHRTSEEDNALPYKADNVFRRLIAVLLPSESYSGQYALKFEPALQAAQREIVVNRYIPRLKATYEGCSNKLTNALSAIEAELKVPSDIEKRINDIKTHIAKTLTDDDLANLATEIDEKGFNTAKPVVKIPELSHSLQARVIIDNIRRAVGNSLSLGR